MINVHLRQHLRLSRRTSATSRTWHSRPRHYHRFAGQRQELRQNQHYRRADSGHGAHLGAGSGEGRRHRQYIIPVAATAMTKQSVFPEGRRGRAAPRRHAGLFRRDLGFGTATLPGWWPSSPTTRPPASPARRSAPAATGCRSDPPRGRRYRYRRGGLSTRTLVGKLRARFPATLQSVGEEFLPLRQLQPSGSGRRNGARSGSMSCPALRLRHRRRHARCESTCTSTWSRTATATIPAPGPSRPPPEYFEAATTSRAQPDRRGLHELNMAAVVSLSTQPADADQQRPKNSSGQHRTMTS